MTRPAASVTSVVAMLAAPAEDHVSLDGAVSVTVQRSGIREVRLDVAPALGDLLRIEGPDVAEKRRVPGEGRETWIVRFGRLVRDDTVLQMTDRNGIEIDYCPQCRGVWLDRGELDKIIERSAATSSTPLPSYSGPPQQQHPQQPQQYDQRHHKKKRKESFLGELFDF